MACEKAPRSPPESGFPAQVCVADGPGPNSTLQRPQSRAPRTDSGGERGASSLTMTDFSWGSNDFWSLICVLVCFLL